MRVAELPLVACTLRLRFAIDEALNDQVVLLKVPKADLIRQYVRMGVASCSSQ